MAEEPKTALAAFFQMRGLESISETDFVLEASHRLRWFTPKEAQAFLQIGVDRGLLRAEAGTLRPSFDVGGVAVPVNYRPGPEVLAAPPKPMDPFTQVLARMEGATARGRPQLVAQVNEVQAHLGVDADVAAAIVARRLGIDVADILAQIETDVLRRAR